MSAFAIELLKKINEKNMIWFALAIILVVAGIAIYPEFFVKLCTGFENVGIKAPYSKIIIGLLYLSVGVIVIKPIIMFLSYRKRTSKFRNQLKQFKKLSDDEVNVLYQFAAKQRNTISIPPAWIHKARLLKTKGLLSNSWNSENLDGSEDFYMNDELLGYLTEYFHDQIHALRTKESY